MLSSLLLLVVGATSVAFVPAIASFPAIAGMLLAFFLLLAALLIMVFLVELVSLYTVLYIWDILCYRVVRLRLSDCYFFLCNRSIGKSIIGLVNRRKYRNLGYWIKSSIYRTIGYRTHKNNLSLSLSLRLNLMCIPLWCYFLFVKLANNFLNKPLNNLSTNDKWTTARVVYLFSIELLSPTVTTP